MRTGKGSGRAIVVLVTIIATALAAGGAILAGTDVKVNQDPPGIDLQNEISLVASPSNPSNIVAVYNDDQDKSGGFSTGPGIGASCSFDSGATWTTTRTPTIWGHDFDPSVTADTLGNTFAGSISSTTTWSYPYANTEVAVHRSGDGGVTWSQPTTVEAFWGNGVTAVPFLDKSYVACDTFASSSYKDRLYIAWQRDSTDGVHSEIYFAGSVSQAATFTVPVKVNDQLVSNSLGNAPVPAVGPDGTVAVVWLETMQHLSNQTPAAIMFDKSTDGGVTFGADTTVAAFTKVQKNPNAAPYSSFRANSFPCIAIDPTNANNMHVVFTGDPDEPGGPDAGDVFYSRSTNGGVTWSPYVKLSDDVGTRGQFSPWVSVTPSGTVYAAWYDRRNDPGDIHLNVFYTKSTDGGATFSANQTVNDTPITLIPDNPPTNPSSAWLGEYLGLDTDGTYAYFAWTDTRLGEKDIYFDKLAISSVPSDTTPPVTTLATTPAAPDGENGWYATTPLIGLTPNETATTFYQWDSTQTIGWQTYLGGFSGLEGQHVLYYFSVDSANNTETVNGAQFKVDTAAPTGTMEIDNGAAMTTTTTVSLDSTVTGATLMRFRNPADAWPGWEATASSRSWTLPSGDGTKTVEGEFKDDAGNTLAVSDQIVLETAPPLSDTTLTAQASAALVGYGGGVFVSGSLTASGAVVTSSTGVTLWSRPSGGAGWAYRADGVFDPGSVTYRSQATCTYNTEFQMRFSGDATSSPATSNVVTVRAPAFLSRPWTSPVSPRRFRRFYVYGYLKPRHSGYTVLYFYRKVGRVWRYCAKRSAKNYDYLGYTRYRLAYALAYTGYYRVRAYHFDGSHYRTCSTMKTFKVW